MKTTRKNIRIHIAIWRSMVVTLLILLLGSCSKDEPAPLPEQVETPILASISPTSGPKTTIVTIKGSNFGTDIGTVKVYFNGKEGAVQSVNETQIIATVPAKANTGNVKVTVKGTELTGPLFTYIISEVQVSVFAGSIGPGFADGTGLAAGFTHPDGLAFDGPGNIYVADEGNHRIRKITPSGVVSTLAGTTSGFEDGPVSSAKFSDPFDVALDDLGNVYVTEIEQNRIRKISPGGVVSTFAGSNLEGYADGEGANAQFFYPLGMAIDASGNVYVADSANNKIRKITPDGMVSTFAGSAGGFADGIGTAAQFKSPHDIEIDASGNLYVADTGNHSIRKITPEGVVNTLAGTGTDGFWDGTGPLSKFNWPNGLAIDAFGNVYVADTKNNKIRKITPEGMVSTVAGSNEGFANGAGASAKFFWPTGVLIDKENTLYIADSRNHRVRKITQE